MTPPDRRPRVRAARGMPFAAQLLLTFVALVAGTTFVLTVVAYQTSLQSLEAEGRARVRQIADARAQILSAVLLLRQQRVDGLLAGAQQLCTEPAGSRVTAWAEDCVGTLVKEFRLTEHATSAVLTFKGRVIVRAGQPIETWGTAPGTVARVVERRDGTTNFLINGELGDAVLTIEFDSSEIVPLFTNPEGLGRTGQVFLTAPDGRLLTPLKGAPEIAFPPGLDREPLAECRSHPGEIVDLDYRGIETIHAYRPVAAIGGGCVDAHLSRDEVLEPADSQRAELVARGAGFTLVGALLSLLLTRRIAAPVRRLEAAARELQAGAFDAPVPIGGPLEVRTLGRAFTDMAADLSQLVAREQAARREAEAANRSKDHFIAMLSHELRTPLNAILGWARLLRTGPIDAERVERATGAIERGSDALRRLIEDLLDVSRIVAGKLRMVRSATSLPVVTEAALDAVRPQAAEKGVDIETTVAERPLLVLGDPQRLQQVVWNLVWNAVKFTPTGGRVCVGVSRAGDQAELSVSDTGIGIEPDVLPHIFEWFRQENDNSDRPESGLGLGLGLVQQLVTLHGGRVRAESGGRGTGATFTVTLPLIREAPETIGEPAGDHAASPSSLRGIRVLCVDDDPASRELVRAVLLNAGAEVHTAAGAEEARRHLLTWQPHLLILDIAMPHEDGYALVRSLRATSITLPAIALTAYARRDDADQARAAGFQVHMPKPIDPARLVRTAAALVHR